MITVVLWKWGRKYTGRHLSLMRSMVSRHLSLPHRFVCITDKPNDVPDGMASVPMPKVPGPDFKCIRRLWIYSPKAAALGDRLFQLDLDMVVTGGLDPIVDRPDPFVIWKSDSNVIHGWGYNPSVILMTAGARADVWERYAADPKGCVRRAEKAGWWPMVNSDQAVMSHLMQHDDVPVWTDADGVCAYRVIAGKHGQRGKVLPEGVRIVSFHGPRDPSVPDLQQKSPWIQEHWR